MGALAEEALRAGALGITTSRTTKHRARDGRYTPSLTAAEPELFAIAGALRRAGKGVLEVNSDFGDGDFEILRMAAEAAGRPMSLLLLQVDNAPDLWRRTLDQIHAARRAGLDVTGQVGAKSIGVLFGLETSRNPFENHPAFAPLLPLAPRQRYERLRDDAALRQRLVDERPTDALTRWFDAAFARTFAMAPVLDYEPAPDQRPTLRPGGAAQAHGIGRGARGDHRVGRRLHALGQDHRVVGDRQAGAAASSAHRGDLGQHRVVGDGPG
jgi:N-acyl-D-aspartate/D-glutamate deacylase